MPAVRHMLLQHVNIAQDAACQSIHIVSVDCSWTTCAAEGGYGVTMYWLGQLDRKPNLQSSPEALSQCLTWRALSRSVRITERDIGNI